jgi:hypothetical protein
MEDIRAMAAKQTKVMLFRLIRHFKTPLHQSWLQQNDILKRSPQSITKISNEAFEKIMIHAK